MYSSWDIEHNILKSLILGHFLPFYPPKKTPKSQFWKIRDHHFFTEWDRQNFLWFWATFCPFTSPSPNYPENQNFEQKKWKQCLEMLSFHIYMCTINEDHMTQKTIILKKWKKTPWRYYHLTNVYHKWVIWCMVPEIWSATNRIFCHLDCFLHFYFPNNLKK